MPETHFEAVRPGVILYGYYPSEEVDKTKVYLKPVMSLKTNIVHLKKVPIGEYISYGRKFKTERESIIGTLPVGYADGYTRSLGEEAKVIINGKLVPVVGRICMDQCMVDLTNVPDVNLGDEVILMGEDSESKMTADELASILGTINYEVLCMISRRVPRVYVKDKKVIKIRSYV
ncbi:Alanine racemase 1 [bioreactor metagenome]|uniref:Alanine racemase 1 n=2 Tax=root TaxID=1 RepID=A0A645DGZ7_9ZZZZ